MKLALLRSTIGVPAEPVFVVDAAQGERKLVCEVREVAHIFARHLHRVVDRINIDMSGHRRFARCRFVSPCLHSEPQLSAR